MTPSMLDGYRQHAAELGDTRDARAILSLLETVERIQETGAALTEVVRDLCIQLASAGEEPKADSNNPIEALFARALAAFEAATGIADPFAHAMAQICADNRAAIAKAEGR